MKTMKRESENCMDFIEAVHRRRVYPLMYCHAELSGSLNIEILKHSAFGQFVPKILCAYDYRHNRFIDKGFTEKDVIHTAEPALPQCELDKAPQFRIIVCQKRHTASVIFGMTHILADGKGFLQYLYLLAALYNGKNPDVHNKREISFVLDGIHVGRQTMRIRYGKAPAVQPLRSQNQKSFSTYGYLVKLVGLLAVSSAESKTCLASTARLLCLSGLAKISPVVWRMASRRRRGLWHPP